MNRLAFVMAAVAPVAVLAVEPSLDQDTNVLTFNVESGEETYSTAISSGVAGIVKTGGGTLTLDTASTSFTGGKSITVSGGTLKITHKDALGSGNTVTVENGAQYRMIYNATQNDCGGQNNDIVLKGGDGPDHMGALYGTGLSATTASDYFWGNVTLEGDATIGCSAARGFGKTLNLGGNTLTIKGPMRLAGSGTTVGKVVTVKNPGKIRFASGTAVLQGAPVFEDEGFLESAGGSLQFWNMTRPIPWKLNVQDANLTLQMGRGNVSGQGGTPNVNIWAGDVNLGSGRTLSLTGSSSYKTDYITLAGKITGEGGISIGNNAEYRLSGVNNTYSGGTTIGANTLKVFADGNVSTNGPVKLSGGVLELHLENAAITSDYVAGLAAKMAQSQYSDGRGTLRFITGSAQNVTLTSDFSPMHPSIAIYHAGTGSLTFSGEMISDPLSSGTMLGNTAGTVAFDGDWNRWLWSFNCAGGTMDVKGGSLCRAYNDGKRSYLVGGSNDVSNARMRIHDGGTLHFPAAGGDSSESIKVEDLGTKPAILEIYDGATVTGKVQVANAANTRGAVYQYGGDVFHMTRPGNDGVIGNFGQAYWWMDGGTFKAEHANPYLGLASKTGSESQFEVQGGTVSLTGANSLLICRGGASNAEFYMGGGTANIGQIQMGGELQWAADKGADPGGQAVLTLSGTNNPSLTASTLRLNERTNEFTSVVNLNAGLLTASTLSDVTKTSATRKDCNSYLNFNGGALKTANTAFLNGDHVLTKVTVFGKGGSIDITATGQVNWDVPVQRAEGRGIKSITVPDEVDVSGYAMPPVVYISGGGGDGATAHVRFNPRTGRIDREIEVTCPGWGYLAEPTVTITASDMKTPVTCEVALTEGDQEDGGLTIKKGGSGSSAYLMVYAANTYTGDTVIAGGTFYMQHAEAIPLHSNIRLAGGHLATKGYNPSRAKLSGYGSFASWQGKRLTITEEIGFDAADLAEGRKIRCTDFDFYIGANCVIAIKDIDSLTGDTYQLMDATNTGVLHGKARFAEGDAASLNWRLSLSADGKSLKLRRIKGTTVSVR